MSASKAKRHREADDGDGHNQTEAGKVKKAAKSKPAAKTGALPSEEVQLAPPKKKQKKQKQDKLAKVIELPKKHFEGANAEEAAAIRERLGIKASDPNSASTKTAFTFGFAPAPTECSDHDSDIEAAEGAEGAHPIAGPAAGALLAPPPHTGAIDPDLPPPPIREPPPEPPEPPAPFSRARAPVDAVVDADGNIERRIYAGGMPFWYTDVEVRECWSTCGEIQDLQLLTFPDTGRFRGIAFVTFATQEAYETALKYNGDEIEGMTLVVKKCKAPPSQAPAATKPPKPLPAKQDAAKSDPVKDKKVFDAAPGKVEGYNVAFVGNIAWEINKQTVEDLFVSFNPKFVRMFDDPATKKHRGFAHVHFNDGDSLDRAMALNGTVVMGRTIKVMYAQPSAKHLETKAQSKAQRQSARGTNGNRDSTNPRQRKPRVEKAAAKAGRSSRAAEGQAEHLDQSSGSRQHKDEPSLVKREGPEEVNDGNASKARAGRASRQKDLRADEGLKSARNGDGVGTDAPSEAKRRKSKDAGGAAADATCDVNVAKVSRKRLKVAAAV